MEHYRDTEQYICEMFLDLVEQKPFYKIYVKELTAYGHIGRSTFYMYFDSIYAVVQKLEDDFMDGFLSPKDAINILFLDDKKAMDQQLDFLKKNARTLTLLAGPNGDPSFTIKLYKRFEQICEEAWKYNHVDLPPMWKETVRAFISGGCLRAFQYHAALGDEASAAKGVVDFVNKDLSRLLNPNTKLFQSGDQA